MWFSHFYTVLQVSTLCIPMHGIHVICIITIFPSVSEGNQRYVSFAFLMQVHVYNVVRVRHPSPVPRSIVGGRSARGAHKKKNAIRCNNISIEWKKIIIARAKEKKTKKVNRINEIRIVVHVKHFFLLEPRRSSRWSS